MQSNKKKIKYLITGGSGFIGSNLANYINKFNFAKVYILDIKSPPKCLSKNINYKQINLLNKIEINSYIKNLKPNYIFHLAARTDLNSTKISSYKVNYEGVRNLIEACNKLSSIKRVIFASSMLVCRLGYIPKNDYDFLPPNAYGSSKMLGEKVIRESNINFSWCIVRPTSIWGPGFKNPYSKFFELILKGRYVHIGRSKVYKTYGYVENTCFQMNSIMNASKKMIQGQVFYLGDSNKYIIREWAEEIADISKSKKIKTIPNLIIVLVAIFGSIMKFFRLDFPITIFRYKNMTKNNQIDLEKIKTLSKKLPYSRIEGTKSTINWLKKEV